MPKQNVIITNFTTGVVSPLVRGRVDSQRYANGVETLNNFIARPQGAIVRRSGTALVKPTKFHDSKCRIYPFRMSDADSYLVEFGVGYIHFCKDREPLWESTTTELEAFIVSNNGGLMQIEANDISGSGIDVPGWGPLSNVGLTDNGTITLSDNGSGAVRITTSVPHTLRTGVKVYIVSSEIAGISLTQYTITRISAYAVDLQGSAYSAPGAGYTVMFSNGVLPGDRIWISGATEYPELSEKSHIVHSQDSWYQFTLAQPYANHGTPSMEEAWTIPVEIVTDYTEADLAELTFCQSADVLYVFHPDYPTRKLARLDMDGDRNDWLWATVDWQDGPYLPLNDLAPNVDTTTPANGTRYRDVYLEISSYAHTATVTVPSGATAFDTADDNKYIEYREGDQWRLAKLPGTIATNDTTATVTIIDNVLLHFDETTKFKRTVRTDIGFGIKRDVTYNAGSPNASPSVPGAGTQRRVDPNNYIVTNQAASPLTAGTLTSNYTNTFGAADVGKFVRFFSNEAGTAARKPLWAQLTRITNTTTALHATPVSMASNNTTGNFVISSHSRTCTVKSYRAGVAFSMFASTDVGRHIRIGFGGRWTWGKITAYTSASEVSVTLYEDPPRDPHNAANLAGALDGSETAATTSGRTYDWRLGAFSETTGYASHGVFHEQRLWMARTDTQPQSMWGSVSGDFENMRPTELDSTVLDDNAVSFTLASTEVNPIKWLRSGPALTIGTIGGEWQAKAGSSISEPITPGNIVIVPHTSHGSADLVQPIRVGNNILFADRACKRVWSLYYDFSVDGLVSEDVSFIAEHLLREGDCAIRSAFQQEPNNIAWYLLGDGTLAALTWDKPHEVGAWHRHVIADSTSTDAFVEDIAVVPKDDGTQDDLYLVVKRSVNGSTKRYIERLEQEFEPVSASSRTGMRFLDGFIEITNHSATTISGLHSMEGKTVTVVGNGTVVGTFTVSSGTVSIGLTTYATVLVGIPYTSTVKSLPPEAGSAFGTSQGKIKRILKMHARILNALALSYGWNQNGASLNETTDLYGTASTNFYTGTRELIPNNPNDPESQWTLQTSRPYPLSILSVTLTVECGE